MPKNNIYFYEDCLISLKYNNICGIDEAGRGSLAGPVIAAAVIMPKNIIIDEIDDSKRLTAAKREKLFNSISELALSIGIGIVDEEIIDEINILNATYLAMQKALSDLTFSPDYILVDALRIPEINIPQRSIIHGDRLSYSIACASIIAKVTRDKLMYGYHQEFSIYGFDKHKGYATKDHIQVIKTYGICKLHRRSFAPISKLFPLA